MKTPIKLTKTSNSKLPNLDFNNIPFGKIMSDHMFICDYDGRGWQNSRIEEYGPIPMSPALSCLHYAQSFFEGMKAYKTVDEEIVLFRPEKNWERLNTSAKRLSAPEVPKDLFFDALNTLLELDKEWIPKGKDKSLYIRPFIFASDEYIGMRPSETYKFVIFTCPVSAYYSAPVKVKIETHFTRAPLLGGTGSVKASGNYGGTLYPARLAKEEGYDQLIWTDSNAHKYLEEAGTMNVFFVIDGVVITPDLGDSILPGVTRQSVLELAKSWGLKTEERKISIEEIISAIEQGRLQEAFGTGTAATITSIELIGYNNTKYPLPILSETSFSKKILNYLDSLKAGEIEDKFGWLYKIKN